MHITNMINVLHNMDIKKFYERQALLSVSIDVQSSDRFVSAAYRTAMNKPQISDSTVPHKKSITMSVTQFVQEPYEFILHLVI